MGEDEGGGGGGGMGILFWIGLLGLANFLSWAFDWSFWIF